MRQTVVGVFNRYAEAQHAAQQLRESGFGDSVYLTESLGEDGSAGTSTGAAPERDEGVLAHIRQFFAGLFGDDDTTAVQPYADAVRRGGAVVRVEVDEERDADSARGMLESAGAVDVGDENTAAQEPALGGLATSSIAPDESRSGDADEQVIPVVQEELQVGKRRVAAGGVRVFARSVETPVHESVEEPVVHRDARVVEEVRVGKAVEERTEQVDDSVRRTEVQVEPLQGGRATGAGASDDSARFRQHFDSHYANRGERYEDYEPAYRYGRSMSDDPRYRVRDWDASEPELRRDWETRYPGSAWERFKAAVRHGWERMTE